jgi:hypothetical protein
MDAIQVRLDRFAEPQEIEAVQQVMADAGIPAELRGGYEKPRPGLARGEADEPEWIILLLLSSTFGAFFTAFFGAAGADSWKALKRFAKDLGKTRRRPTGPTIPPSPPHLGAIHIVDQHGNRIQEGLYPEMPDNDFWKAWQSISEPDWSEFAGWFVHWDMKRGAWAAFSPTGDRHLYWDRETGQWQDIE